MAYDIHIIEQWIIIRGTCVRIAVISLENSVCSWTLLSRVGSAQKYVWLLSWKRNMEYSRQKGMVLGDLWKTQEKTDDVDSFIWIWHKKGLFCFFSEVMLVVLKYMSGINSFNLTSAVFRYLLSSDNAVTCLTSLFPWLNASRKKDDMCNVVRLSYRWKLLQFSRVMTLCGQEFPFTLWGDNNYSSDHRQLANHSCKHIITYVVMIRVYKVFRGWVPK